jgi:protein TonB
MRKPAAAGSVAFHGAAILVLLSLHFYPPGPPKPFVDRFVTISLPPRVVAKSGGGGQRQPLPASLGQPPKPAPREFTIPPSMVLNTSPKLPLQTALLEAPDISIDSPDVGDPTGRIGVPSGGPGGPWGFGDGGTRGIGKGPGGPRQGTEGSMQSVVKLTRQPQVIYKEEPEYSDEARKAHFEGTVILAFDVDLSGRAMNIRVVRSLGLGLDEKAIAAVTRWKFRPAIAGNKSVVAPAEVQVTFRLL